MLANGHDSSHPHPVVMSYDDVITAEERRLSMVEIQRTVRKEARRTMMWPFLIVLVWALAATAWSVFR